MESREFETGPQHAQDLSKVVLVDHARFVAGHGLAIGSTLIPEEALYDFKVEQSNGGAVELVLRVACNRVTVVNADGDETTWESHV